MISKGTNNKQNGQGAIPCDAGSVVMGRDNDNGSYKILKLNPDGSLFTPSSFVQNANYSDNIVGVPASVPPLSSVVIDTYIAKVPVSFGALNQGIYKILPYVLFQTTTNATNSINIFLIKENSDADLYFSTLNPITDNYSPLLINQTFGIVEFWHGVQMNNISNITRYKQTSQANLEREIYLNGGVYYYYITANNPFILDNGQILVASANFQQIG